MDLRRAKTLVFAVVPFDQVVIDLGLGAKASQLACAASSQRWARKIHGRSPVLGTILTVAAALPLMGPFTTNRWCSIFLSFRRLQ